MSKICVVHLVRKRNGLQPFHDFLDSYLKNPAGVEHDLVILYKGFGRKSDIDPYEKLLKDVPHSYLMVADFGFDLRPYFVAAKKYKNEYFCFLNSFSVILDKDWLLKFYRHITQPGIGMVSATGSWGRIRPGKIVKPELANYKQWLRKCVGLFLGIYFDNFPNYHLRTNGFMIPRRIFLKIRHGNTLTKMQALMLESGKYSLTKQVRCLGLSAILVGKNGNGYAENEWNVSHTFWQGTQSNLLIADNQTRKFEFADLTTKQQLKMFAWGESVNNLHDNKSESQ